MFQLMRRGRRALASTLALSVVALSTAMASPVFAAGKTITAVMHSDLRIIDPIFTTAYITRDHGYMVYDTLITTDANFKIQPQMADWKISDDKLTYTFTLLNSDVVNAFAVPGGYIYITRGLMALADNEAELAGVLAHELGHITALHHARRQGQGLLASVLVTGAAGIGTEGVATTGAAATAAAGIGAATAGVAAEAFGGPE